MYDPFVIPIRITGDDDALTGKDNEGANQLMYYRAVPAVSDLKNRIISCGLDPLDYTYKFIPFRTVCDDDAIEAFIKATPK